MSNPLQRGHRSRYIACRSRLGTQNGQAVARGGRVLNVASILWCTGFGVDFSWVHLPVFAPDGYPFTSEAAPFRSPDCTSSGCLFSEAFLQVC